MLKLTDRQREILAFISQHTILTGEAPSIHEIKDRFGLASTGTVHKHLVALEKRGVIERTKHYARSTRII